MSFSDIDPITLTFACIGIGALALFVLSIRRARRTDGNQWMRDHLEETTAITGRRVGR